VLPLFIRWILLTAAVLGGAIGLIRAQPLENRDLAAVLQTSAECIQPCWQGVRLGVTTGPSALALADQMDFVRDLGSQLDTFPGQIFWHWPDNAPTLVTRDDRWAYIWLEDNVARNIFLPGVRHYADLFLLLGQPEKVIIFSDSVFALGPVIYMSIYPNQVYAASLIHCQASVADLWRAPTTITIGQQPEYEGAFQREFLPRELRGWLPDQICLRG